MTFIKDLLLSKNPNQTVFSLSDLSFPKNGFVGKKLNSAIKYAVNNNELIRISQGLYCLAKDYAKPEFANKFRSPSYISLYSVLQESGVVFQLYSSIYSVSKRSEEITVDNQKYIYRKISDKFLLNPIGINYTNNVSRATPERAICDKLYLDGVEFFDNLRQIDPDLINKINNEVYDNNKTISKWISINIK